MHEKPTEVQATHEKPTEVPTLFAALKEAISNQHGESASAESAPPGDHTGGRYRCLSRNGVATRSMPTEHGGEKQRGPSFGEEIAVEAMITTEHPWGSIDYLQLLGGGGYCPMRLSHPRWKVDGSVRIRAAPDLRSAVTSVVARGDVYGTAVDCPLGGYPWVQLADGAGYMLTQSTYLSQ